MEGRQVCWDLQLILGHFVVVVSLNQRDALIALLQHQEHVREFSQHPMLHVIAGGDLISNFANHMSGCSFISPIGRAPFNFPQRDLFKNFVLPKKLALPVLPFSVLAAVAVEIVPKRL